jgi:hypothetical protein
MRRLFWQSVLAVNRAADAVPSAGAFEGAPCWDGCFGEKQIKIFVMGVDKAWDRVYHEVTEAVK